MAPLDSAPADPNAPLQKKPISYKNLALGASMFYSRVPISLSHFLIRSFLYSFELVWGLYARSTLRSHQNPIGSQPWSTACWSSQDDLQSRRYLWVLSGLNSMGMDWGRNQRGRLALYCVRIRIPSTSSRRFAVPGKVHIAESPLGTSLLIVRPFQAGIIGGMSGGIAQAYSTMGFCTFMKTVEVTRHKSGMFIHNQLIKNEKRE